MIKNNTFLIPTLMLGVFALLSMELGAMGLLPLIADFYQVSVSDAGWVVSIFALIVAFSAPILPLLVAKYDTKKVMLVCLSIFAITSLFAAFCTNFILLLVLRAIPAFFHPIYCALAFSVAANAMPKGQEIKGTSKIFAAVSAGMTLGIPLASYLASKINLEFSFAFFAILNALAFVATIFFVPSQKAEEAKSQKEQFKVLAMPVVWASIALVVVATGAMFGFYSYMSEFLLNFTHIDFTLISLLLLAYGLSNVVGNFIAGKAFVRSANLTLWISLFIMLVLYILLFVFGTNVLLTSLILIILGVFAGIVNSGDHFMLTQPIPQAKEFANGLFISTANIGTTLGTALCGLFISLEGSGFAVLASVALVVLSLIIFALRAKLLKEKI
ncbi:MFS transporter [Campylobacter sp. MIT 19-121]|uniref:MFS transporter n=1 Tax=Campylobacter sp. MIT 19-121 TaxID=2703906 RepID=UPI0013896318|nr:MFS transporter [Campylobacter sp. MIT 19-121]NDJ27110.1 MFS transporter [Campylobacter sp. MIT 19-121]